MEATYIPFYLAASIFKAEMGWWILLVLQISLLLLLSHSSCVRLCANPKTAAHQAPPVPGILQARTLGWVAISVSNAWKWEVKVKSLSRVVMPDVRIPEREERRLLRQCNSQKGKFIADSSQGSCCIQRSGAGSESPEPKLLYEFIGWA